MTNLWTETHRKHAHSQGWDVFAVDGHADKLQVQRLDEVEFLESDANAVRLVRKLAQFGDPTCCLALWLTNTPATTAYDYILLTPMFWDCECKKNYIHHKSDKACAVCGALSEEQDNSRVMEVLEHGFTAQTTTTVRLIYFFRVHDSGGQRKDRQFGPFPTLLELVGNELQDADGVAHATLGSDGYWHLDLQETAEPWSDIVIQAEVS